MSLKPHLLAIATATPLLFVVGCLPGTKPEVRQGNKGLVTGDVSTGTSPASGRLIAPRRNGLKTAIIARAAKDPVINEKLWSSVDEHCVPPETIKVLEANGLRVGLITGSLPVETEATMNEPPPNRVDPVLVDLPDGDPTELRLSSASEPVTIMMTREGRTQGKDYTDAGGVIRINANQDGSGGVTLKLTPEIHHGPVTKEFTATPMNGQFTPSEFMMKTGQQVENFRDLTATITVKPGQIAVIGGRTESGRDIGSFLFSESEKKSDRIKQKVVLIWATPYGGLNISTSTSRDVLPSSIPSQPAP